MISQDLRRGFTLLELVVVMALLAAVFAIISPSLSLFFSGRRLHSDTRRLLSLTRYARSQAVSLGQPMAVWIEPESGLYGLTQKDSYIPNEEMEVEGSVGHLTGRLLHHSVRSLDRYSEKMERSSSWRAEDRGEAGRHSSPWKILTHTWGRFIRMYVLKGGFLDGGHGLVLSLLASFSVFQKYTKLWERDRTEADPE